MERIRGLYRLVATVTCLVCLGFSVGMCSESGSLIKTYVSSSLSSDDGLVHSAKFKVHKISGSEWDSLVMNSELPVMVMFTADWCGPCRLMGPILNRFESDYTGRFKFYTVDNDEESDIAQRFGIRALPTSIVVKGGEVMAKVVGANPSELKRVLESYV